MLSVTLKTHHLLQKPHFLLQTLIFFKRFSLDSTRKSRQGEVKEEEEVSSVLISHLVLSHAGDAQTLTLTLLKHPNIHLSPGLVDRVLKNLWNDGPKALLFFQTLVYHHPSYKPSTSSFDHALDIAGRLRDRRTLRRLLSLRCKLGLPPTPRSFAIIMERFVSAGKPDRAVRLFLSMHHYGCHQDLSSFNTLLDILCKARRVEKACSLFKVFKHRFRADTISYNIIANGWCLIKRTSRALEALKEMVESGLEPTLTTYNILLRGFFRAGQVKEAWEFFLQMKKRSKEGLSSSPDVVSYTTLVHGLGLSGQVEKARQVFEEMIDRGCLPSVPTYNALIQVICKKDCVQNAVLVFDDMLRKGYMPNSITYNLLIRGLCHGGEMDRAVELLDRMKQDECAPNVQTYNVLIRYYCEAGEIEKGLDLFGKMGKCEGCLPNIDTYNVMISAMFVRKRPEDMLIAGKLLAEMVDRGNLPRRFMFNRVLNGLILTGNQAFARELLRVQSRCRHLLQKIKL